MSTKVVLLAASATALLWACSPENSEPTEVESSPPTPVEAAIEPEVEPAENPPATPVETTGEENAR